jgi:hypothetical protein
MPRVPPVSATERFVTMSGSEGRNALQGRDAFLEAKGAGPTRARRSAACLCARTAGWARWAGDPYASAITTTLSLLEKAAAQDDEVMSELITDVHPRAAAKIRMFAEILANHDAGFAAEFEGGSVRLPSGEEARRVVVARRGEDIREDDEQHVGTLLGVLPESRQFECRLADGRVVRGKVDRAVSPIQDFKNAWENKKVILQFRVVSVRSRARYVLLSASALAVSPDDIAGT